MDINTETRVENVDEPIFRKNEIHYCSSDVWEQFKRVDSTVAFIVKALKVARVWVSDKSKRLQIAILFFTGYKCKNLVIYCMKVDMIKACITCTYEISVCEIPFEYLLYDHFYTQKFDTFLCFPKMAWWITYIALLYKGFTWSNTIRHA